MKLRRYLKLHDLSQAEFAEEAGVDQTLISHYLTAEDGRGERTPDLVSALAIDSATKGLVPPRHWIRFKKIRGKRDA